MNLRSVLLVVIICVSTADMLQAQLIAPRTRRSTGRSSSTGTSTLFGADLGIQERRGPGAFVGADPTDATGFIGVDQAVIAPPVATATESLQEQQVQNVNQVPPRQTAGGVYAPRLTIAFSVPSTPSKMASPQFGPRRRPDGRRTAVTSPLLIDPAQRLKVVLGRTLGTESLGPIQVAVASRTATLRGTVASDDARSRAELLASFEPGIDRVQNDLVVQPPAPATQE